MNEVADRVLLNYLLENGNIDLRTALDGIEKMKRNEILAKHEFTIWLGKDGYYRTYIRKGSDRQLVKKKNLTDVEDLVIQHIEQQNKTDDTFKSRFNIWVERQRLCGVTEETIKRYNNDYKRFFKGYPIERMNIQDITETELLEHISNLLNKMDLPYKSLTNMWGNIRGVFRKSIIDKVIPKDADPCVYVDLKMLKRLCVEKDNKSVEERTLSTEERKILLERLRTKTCNVNWVANMAVELALYTGMRVGELAGLKWCDVDFEKKIIIIRNQEAYNPKTKEYYIKETKNHKVRHFPITDEIQEVLLKVKKYELENGWLNEFVFADADGKMHKNRISSCAKSHTHFKSSTKSIHAIRRTVNSNLKSNGVSTTVACALLGHTERVNENNYTYDVLDTDTKIGFVSTATKII